MTTAPARKRSPRPPQEMPPPATPKGGTRFAGKFDDKGHYLPVAYQLRLLREQAGMDQRQFAAATEEAAAQEVKEAQAQGRRPLWTKGLSEYSINRYENGFHSPTARSAALLARTLTLALSRLQGVPVAVTADDLRVRDAAGLASYLRSVQGDRPDDDFYGAMGIAGERARNLLAGTSKWTADELGAVAIAFPQAANAARDVMIAQARRKRRLPAYRAFALRDKGHPEYVPPDERAS